MIVGTFFGIPFLWDWKEKLILSSPVATVEFSKFADIPSAALLQHHILRFEIAQMELHHRH